MRIEVEQGTGVVVDRMAKQWKGTIVQMIDLTLQLAWTEEQPKALACLKMTQFVREDQA